MRDRRPAAHRDGDVGARGARGRRSRRRRSPRPSGLRPRDAATMRRFCSGVARATTWSVGSSRVEPRVVPAPRAPRPVTIVLAAEPASRGDRGGRRGVVAGHDDRPGCPAVGRHPARRGSPSRIGSAKPTSARSAQRAVVAVGRGRAPTSRSPRAARRLDRRPCHALHDPEPASRSGRARPATASGAPSAELLDAAVAAARSRRRDGPCVGRPARPATRSARVERGRRRRLPRPPRASAGVNEPAPTPARARHASSSARSASVEDGRAAPGRPTRAVAGRRHRRDLEPVLGERAGLVGDDQVDRAERLLGVQPPDEHAAPEQPVRPEPEHDGEEDRRLLGDRGDRGRDAGEEVRRRPGCRAGSRSRS